MYDFFVYNGKNYAELDDGKFGHLQKCAQFVVKPCDDLPVRNNYEVFFDNWFTTLDLLHHFKLKGIYSVGTIRLNPFWGCPLAANKELMKNGRGAMDYPCDSNSGMMAVKWLISHQTFLELSLFGSWKVWKGEGEKKHPCPQIVQQYNKSMGGVDLADMLLLWYQYSAI